MTFHVNPKTGKTGVCGAEKGGCPFGSEFHGATLEAVTKKFEATQKNANLPSRVSKGPKTAQDRALVKIAKATDALKANQDARAKLMGTIELELKALNTQAAVVRAERSAAITQFFEAATVDDLADPLKADFIYMMGWDSGHGQTGFYDFGNRVFKGTNASFSNWKVDDESRKAVPGLSIEFQEPSVEFSDKQARTLKMIEPIYDTQRGIMDDVKITLNGYASEAWVDKGETGAWEIHADNSTATDFSSQDLGEVFDYFHKIVAADPDNFYQDRYGY